MSTQRRSSSSAVAPTLEATTTALKIAREATDAVPIAKQILGAAANVFELAEKIEKKRQAMFDLVLAAGEYAKQIDIAVAGRVVDAKMQRSLDRLYNIFTKIEALVRKETAPKNAVMRTLRHVFVVLPIKAESLATELEREIKLFQLSSSIDTRLAIADTARIVEEDSQYDGDWRRLRHGDVQKLHVIRTSAVAEGVLTYASARVDNELMIIRYLDKPLDGGHGASHYCPLMGRRLLRTSYPELIRRLSTVHASHLNVVQLYGIRGGSPDATFAAFRSGTRDLEHFVRQIERSAERDNPDPDPCALVKTTLCYKLLDAAWYLKHYHNLVWTGDFATIDESGEPQIGVFDDIEEEALVNTTECVQSIISMLERIRQTLYSSSSQTEQVEKVYGGRFFQSPAKSQLPHTQHLRRLWELLRKEILYVEFDEFRVKSTSTNVHLSEATILHAREHLTSTWEARNLCVNIFDTVLYYALLQRTLPEPVLTGVIFMDPGNGTVVTIHYTTQYEDHISFERFIIDVPRESILNAEIRELFQIDATFSGWVHLDEAECYKEHADSEFPVEWSGPRVEQL